MKKTDIIKLLVFKMGRTLKSLGACNVMYTCAGFTIIIFCSVSLCHV